MLVFGRVLNNLFQVDRLRFPTHCRSEGKTGEGWNFCHLRTGFEWIPHPLKQPSQHCRDQLIVNYRFEARWFGFLGFPYERGLLLEEINAWLQKDAGYKKRKNMFSFRNKLDSAFFEPTFICSLTKMQHWNCMVDERIPWPHWKTDPHIASDTCSWLDIPSWHSSDTFTNCIHKTMSIIAAITASTGNLVIWCDRSGNKKHQVLHPTLSCCNKKVDRLHQA